MNKLAELIATGEITVEELTAVPELIERAKLVTEGLAACKKNILFPLGATEVNCYSHMDNAGEYEAWGHCTCDGIFYCYCNWGGNHLIGQVNLLKQEEVFMAFENKEFCHDLKRFLTQQIAQSTK